MSTKNEEGVWIRTDGKPDPRKGALTGRQKTFARLIVEGLYSNAECAARLAMRWIPLRSTRRSF